MVESIFNQDTWRSAKNLLQTANDDDIDEYCDKNGSDVNNMLCKVLLGKAPWPIEKCGQANHHH